MEENWLDSEQKKRDEKAAQEQIIEKFPSEYLSKYSQIKIFFDYLMKFIAKAKELGYAVSHQDKPISDDRFTVFVDVTQRKSADSEYYRRAQFNFSERWGIEVLYLKQSYYNEESDGAPCTYTYESLTKKYTPFDFTEKLALDILGWLCYKNELFTNRLKKTERKPSRF